MLAATIDQGHIDRRHKLWNGVKKNERDIFHIQLMLGCCYLLGEKKTEIVYHDVNFRSRTPHPCHLLGVDQ
jgi:hypothetical protein